VAFGVVINQAPVWAAWRAARAIASAPRIEVAAGL
jgi:hypothetical protein